MNSYHRILLDTKRFPNNRVLEPKAPEEHWLLAYIKKNPFQSGVALATLYGVLVIFAYHFHIEYFPNFDLKSLASTIFAAAYTALLLLVIFSLSLFAPAYVIGSWGLEEQADEVKKDEGSLQRRINYCFGVAFFIFLIVCLIFLASAKYSLDPRWVVFSLPVAASIPILGPDVVRWLGGGVKSAWTGQKKKSSGATENVGNDAKVDLDKDTVRPTWRRRAAAFIGQWWTRLWGAVRSRKWFILTMSFVAFMELLSMIFLFYMLRDTPEAKAKEITGHVLLKLLFELTMSGAILHFIGGYLVSAWRNPAMKPAHRGASLAAALAAPVLVASVFGNPVLFFALTAMTTKYGNFRAAEMTLTNIGCRIVENGGEHLCVKLSDGTNKLCNVHVMSRIGTETYLLVSYPGKRNAAMAAMKGRKPTASDAARWVLSVYLPSKEILGSWEDTPERHFDKENIIETQGSTPSVCDPVPSVPAPPNTPPAAPAPPLPAPPPPAGNGGNVERLPMGRTMFEFDQYGLTPDGTAALRMFADGLAAKHAVSMSIRVLGHADSIGQPYHNLRLSQMRAITVRNYLRTYLQTDPHAVTNLNIDFNGAGPTQPLLADASCPGKGADEKRVACLKPNRRVEVIATWTGEE